MSDKKRWPAADAIKVADELLAALWFFCERIEVAGSLRRKRAMVGDVEVLYVPAIETRKVDMFTNGDFNTAEEAIAELLASGIISKRPNIAPHYTWGALNKLAIHCASGIPVDMFATTANHFPMSLVIRTGPKDFNFRLIAGAEKRGFKVHAYDHGSGAFTEIATGRNVYPETEKAVLRMAGLDWIEPEHRL